MGRWPRHQRRSPLWVGVPLAAVGIVSLLPYLRRDSHALPAGE